jgi:hypothetical protein
MPALGKSASRWRKRDLDLLGVDYQYDKFDTIDIRVENSEMPPELLNGTYRFTIDMNGLISSH